MLALLVRVVLITVTKRIPNILVNSINISVMHLASPAERFSSIIANVVRKRIVKRLS